LFSLQGSSPILAWEPYYDVPKLDFLYVVRWAATAAGGILALLESARARYKAVLNVIVPVDADPAWIKRALLRTDKSKRVVWFGWVQDRNRGKAFSLIDLEWRRKVEREKERKKVICPLCGEEMRLVSVWETWEDFADVDVPCILGYRESGGGLRG
jgi:hypothetical protein